MRTSPWQLMLAILPAGLLLVVGFTSVSWIPNLIYPGRVLAGVNLAGIDLGGSSPVAARQLLANLADQTELAPIQLQFSGSVWGINPANFDLRVDPERLTKLAMSVGRRGNINQRLYENW